MESRFFRFLGTKREKAKSPTSEIESLRSVSRPTTLQWPLSAFSTRPSSIRSSGTGSIIGDSHSLQAIPYDTVTAGKTPVFSSKPVKGNGPIKLQTTRRLSSGELFTTTQSQRGDLDDIKEGDYIVGGKNKRDVRTHLTRKATPSSTPALSASQSLTNSPGSPQPTLALLSLPNTPTLCENVEDPTPHVGEIVHDGSGAIPQSPTTPLSASVQWRTSSTDMDSSSRFSRASVATSPSVQTSDEQNATIAALLRAEQSRLKELYASGRIEQNTHYKSGESSPTCVFPTPPSKVLDRFPEISLDPLPPPSVDRDNTYTRTTSNGPAGFSSCLDDSSDASSNKRVSLISSCAGSSACTIQTTATDHDAVITRDDIRKLINEMRSTYLEALETHPPTPSRPAQASKKKRRTKSGAPVKRYTAKATAVDRQTWHVSDPPILETPPKRVPKARATSHPAGGPGRLSPVEASPPQSTKRPTVRLQRADSSTLGSILAQIRPDDGCDKPSQENPTALESSNKAKSPSAYVATKREVNVDVAKSTINGYQPALPASNSRAGNEFF